MDPDANLREQIELAKFLVEANHCGSDFLNNAERLGELVLALDEWIKGGGFLPKAWQKNPSKST